jgi:hypothetical protein
MTKEKNRCTRHVLQNFRTRTPGVRSVDTPPISAKRHVLWVFFS